jgi:hypothetical protein
MQIMLRFHLLRLGFLRCNVHFDFFAIGMVVCQGCVDLRQGQVGNLRGDLFRSQALFVLPHDATDGDSRAGYAWPAAADVIRTHNE